MAKPETKFLTLDFDVKAIDEDNGVFEGYASTFKNIDLGCDMVMPGAFKKTIKEAKGKFPILADHDPSKQIGWNIEATEDDKGLLVKGQLMVDDIVMAKERYALMKKALELKTSAGLSIGYMPIKWEIDESNDKQRYRKLKEIKLYEYSFVTFPMNTMAMATAAKQFDCWLNTLDGDENLCVENFVATMKEQGLNELKIKSALVTAAAKINTPAPELNVGHLFDQFVEDIKKI